MRGVGRRLFFSCLCVLFVAFLVSTRRRRVVRFVASITDGRDFLRGASACAAHPHFTALGVARLKCRPKGGIDAASRTTPSAYPGKVTRQFGVLESIPDVPRENVALPGKPTCFLVRVTGHVTGRSSKNR
ncbi:MAG: hypothetical protein IPO75_05980 [Betaproteobacteria bacterium]|nr:hypothetical protein [Betaproteobacteria bacterium]